VVMNDNSENEREPGEGRFMEGVVRVE